MRNINDLLADVARLLPRILEESSDREEMPETTLVEGLVADSGADAIQARSVVGMVRRCLQALSALDEAQLANGTWAFASFPAFLLARSLLLGLADTQYRLL